MRVMRSSSSLRLRLRKNLPITVKSRAEKFHRGLVRIRIIESPASIFTSTSRVARISAISGSANNPPKLLT